VGHANDFATELHVNINIMSRSNEYTHMQLLDRKFFRRDATQTAELCQTPNKLTLMHVHASQGAERATTSSKCRARTINSASLSCLCA
jgi:hypothetical protein